MKLNSFAATNVYGYLKFELDFNSDLTLMTGQNGSGKTSALRLIQALLTPSVTDLITIPFSQASVELTEKNKIISISAKKTNHELTLKVSDVETPLTIGLPDKDEWDYIISAEKHETDLLDEYQVKHSSHDVFQYISRIFAPVFLGLDRTDQSSKSYRRDRIGGRGIVYPNSQRSRTRAQRMISGSLAAGLSETQALIQEGYRRLRRLEETHSEKLREKILLSAFTYSNFEATSNFNSFQLPSWGEQQEILKRQEEIGLALEKVGLKKELYKDKLDDFFSRLAELFKTVQKDKTPGVTVEWFLNKAQVDRVTDLIEIIDEHNSKISKLFAPATKFLDSINAFYESTGKTLQIDSVGQLSVKRPDGKSVPISALSSGERQLLIIFAHLLFNQYGGRSNVFIIDEPELSLHLKWQEMFIERAIEVSPSTQLILATHSPEIVGDFKQHCKPI